MAGLLPFVGLPRVSSLVDPLCLGVSLMTILSALSRAPTAEAMCREPVMAGSVYCPEHHRLCFMPIRSRPAGGNAKAARLSRQPPPSATRRSEENIDPTQPSQKEGPQEGVAFPISQNRDDYPPDRISSRVFLIGAHLQSPAAALGH